MGGHWEIAQQVRAACGDLSLNPSTHVGRRKEKKASQAWLPVCEIPSLGGTEVGSS